MNMTSTDTILNAYKETQTITGTKKRTWYSWQRVAKALSTEGIIANETQRIILDLYDKCTLVDVIAKTVGCSESTVNSYLPRHRPIYNEFLSVSAVVFGKIFLHILFPANSGTFIRTVYISNCIKCITAYRADLDFWYSRQPMIAPIISTLILLSFSFDATFIRAASVSIMR